MIETKSTTFYKIKNLTTLHLNKIKQPKAKPSQFKKMKTLFISQQLSKLSIIEVQKTYKIVFSKIQHRNQTRIHKQKNIQLFQQQKHMLGNF